MGGVLLSWPHSWEPAALAAGRREEHEVPRVEIRNGARLAAALGLGLTLSLGAAPVVALAEGQPLSAEGATNAVPQDSSVLADTAEETLPVWIGDQGYESLYGAIQSASENDVITLHDDILLEKAYERTIGKSVIIDLNGFSVSPGDFQTITIKSDTKVTIVDSSGGGGKVLGNCGAGVINCTGTLTLEGGSIVNTDVSKDSKGAVFVNGESASLTMTGGSITAAKNAVSAQDGGTVTVSGGEIKSEGDGSTALSLYGSEAKVSGGAQITGSFGITLFNSNSKNTDESTHSSLTMNGGSISATYFGISGNNTQSAGCKATISDGTIVSQNPAIYWPMEGELTISGGIVSGSTALEAKMGTIKITGGSFNATAPYDLVYTGNGSSDDGSALKFVGQLYGGSEGQYLTDPGLSVTISGATITSASGNAISVYNAGVETDKSGTGLTCGVTVDDTTTLKSAEGKDAIRVTSTGGFSLTNDGVISGNTTVTNNGLTKMAASADSSVTTQLNEDGTVKTSQTMSTLYSSLGGALADASTSDGTPADVTLIKDVAEDSVVVPEGSNVKLDLESHTLTGNIVNKGSLELAGTGSIEGAVTGNGVTTGDGSNVTFHVASVNGTSCTSLKDAIDKASDGATIRLLSDFAEDVTIPEGKSVTIDLAGRTLTNVSGHTITNKGALTVVDSVGGGVVDNVTNGRAAVTNEVDATAILEAGTYTRSKETGSRPDDGGANTYYNIVNHGNMTLNEGVVVRQDGAFSSLIENGWYNGKENTGKAPSVMVINGGSYLGGINTIKNDDWGKLTINGGAFTNTTQAAVLNWNEATINGGEFNSDQYVVLNGKLDDSMDKGKLVITGGTFVGGEDVDPISQMSGSEEFGTAIVTGGTFYENPIECMEKGSVVRVNEDGTFTAFKKENLGPGTYLAVKGEELTADDFQPGLSITVDPVTGEVTAKRPYTPPAQTGERVEVEQPEGGRVSVSPSRADEGEKVTVTVTPDDGREVVSVTVTDKDGNAVEVAPGEGGTWTFEMPGGPVTVTAETRCDGGELCPSRGLADVLVGEWCHDAVDWAVETGLMTGYDHVDAFGVSDPLSRAQLAQVLWNRAGRPEADATAVESFPDCSEGEFYAEAVAWCASEGIMTGYEDGTFGPADPVTREQLATVLWRAAGSPEADADLSAFPDAADVSAFASEAMAWAVETGAVSGQGSDGTLDPVGDLERSQCAMVFYRLDG